MKKIFNQGFTLIELLMVVSIIGILSAIVLTQLSNARDRGSDAAVKSNLVSVRTQADLYYDSNNRSYGTFSAGNCPTTASSGNVFGVSAIVSAINAAASNGGNGTRCVATTNAYAVAVGLKTANQSWCIDSQGRSKQFAGTPTAAITGSACN